MGWWSLVIGHFVLKHIVRLKSLTAEVSAKHSSFLYGTLTRTLTTSDQRQLYLTVFNAYSLIIRLDDYTGYRAHPFQCDRSGKNLSRILKLSKLAASQKMIER